MNRRRLEVESWRDSMLAAGGTLRLELGGPAQELSDANNRRRTLYGIVRRTDLTDLLRLYDFPNPLAHSASRIPTTTPLQQHMRMVVGCFWLTVGTNVQVRQADSALGGA